MDNQVPDYLSRAGVDISSSTSIPDYVGKNNISLDGKPVKSKNILYSALSAISSSNRQAQAGASEFLRNPMGGADSYMKGFNNPESSETFANQFIRQSLEKNPKFLSDDNTIGAFMKTLPQNLIGSQLDVMANPLQAAIGAGIGRYAEPVAGAIGKGAGIVGKGIADSPFGKAVGGVWNKVGEVIGSGKQLKGVNTELQGLDQAIPAEQAGTKRGMNVLQSAQENMVNEAKNTGKQSVKDLTSKFQGEQHGLQTQLGEQSRQQAELAKGPVSSTSVENGKIYNQRLGTIESNLDKPITKSEYYKQVIEPSIKQISDAELPGGPAQSRIQQLAKEYAPENSVKQSMIGEPQESEISLNKIKNDKNSVYNAMSEGSQQGAQQHGAHEVANDIFQSNHAKFIENRVPEWHAMNQEYGPQIESQRFGYKSFQPGETGTNKGANVIQKAAMKPTSDEAMHIRQLETGTKNFKGTGDLMGKTKDTATALDTLKTTYKGDKEAMLKDIGDRIDELNKSFGQDIAGVKRVGGEKVENMLQRQSSLQQRQAELKHLVGIRNWIGGGLLSSAGLGGAVGAYKVLKR